jgi:hypothetical protein
MGNCLQPSWRGLSAARHRATAALAADCRAVDHLLLVCTASCQLHAVTRCPQLPSLIPARVHTGSFPCLNPWRAARQSKAAGHDPTADARSRSAVRAGSPGAAARRGRGAGRCRRATVCAACGGRCACAGGRGELGQGATPHWGCSWATRCAVPHTRLVLCEQHQQRQQQGLSLAPGNGCPRFRVHIGQHHGSVRARLQRWQRWAEAAAPGVRQAV